MTPLLLPDLRLDIKGGCTVLHHTFPRVPL